MYVSTDNSSAAAEIISNILVDKKNLQLKKKAMSEMSSKNTWEKNNKIILN